MTNKSQGNNKKKSGKGILFLLLVIVIAAVAIYLQKSGVINFNELISKVSNTPQQEDQNIVETPPEPVKTIEIYKGNDRPIAVMIDNHKGAWPQAAINEAYMVYEIIVEGNETRLMALFKGKTLEQVGPVRSARHYFLDYAMENDAIYTHLGWSPQAKDDISELGINNINGIYYDTGRAKTSSSKFWRSREKSAPHNAVTDTESILQIAEEKGYRTTSSKESVLNYVADEVELLDGVDATNIVIPYATSNKVKYVYDEDSKTYFRYSKGILQKDWNTDEEIKVKNIIITFAENYTLDDPENKGRQGVENIGKLDGYYITNGKAIEIVCYKKDRESQTVYKDKNGNEILVNDGNCFVQICPLNADVTIE